MSKLFRGNVSIVTGFDKAGTEDIRLKKDIEGAFNSENCVELLAKANELSKKHKLPLNTWSFYFPVGQKKNLEPVLLADKFGKPKLTMLPPMASKPAAKSKTRKLA
tara:strand:- start:492 stop:809 length:318 start_codon:yes stop_codon:yes gene_type:complete